MKMQVGLRILGRNSVVGRAAPDVSKDRVAFGMSEAPRPERERHNPAEWHLQQHLFVDLKALFFHLIN
jgi:hypothetical protein